MSRKLLWKFLLFIATGTVALFYFIDYFSSRTEADMSMVEQRYRDELTTWGRQAEKLFYAGNEEALKTWMDQLQQQEKTEASIVVYAFNRVAGDLLNKDYYTKYNFGRNVDWPVHLYLMHNPLMEIPFEKGQASFLLLLPDRMVPGSYLPTVLLLLKVLLPLVLMTLLAILLYRHVMQPLRKLERATREFSQGDLSVRVFDRMGKRNDELSALAKSFDQMAARIGQQIVNQRQLIADMSHELRTPLTRLDIAVDRAGKSVDVEKNIRRVARESHNIRRLVEDSLSLAWLDNEQPVLSLENIDLVDLLSVVISDAQFEYPDKQIKINFPDTALIKQSSHFAVGQAIENIVRNALRYTPEGELVEISLHSNIDHYIIKVKDCGPGVPEQYLEAIFEPFFRVDQSRQDNGNSFGLGLSLARRQLDAVGGMVAALNRSPNGLCMEVSLPKAA